MPKYDNSERLSAVSDQDWCEALDELTTYLKWRLKGRTCLSFALQEGGRQ